MRYDTVEFGRRLKAIRVAQGMTQQEVANQINIDRSHYAKMETGKADPSIYVLSELSIFFGVSAEYLIHGEMQDGAILKRKVRSMIEFLSAMEREL